MVIDKVIKYGPGPVAAVPVSVSAIVGPVRGVGSITDAQPLVQNSAFVVESNSVMTTVVPASELLPLIWFRNPMFPRGPGQPNYRQRQVERRAPGG